MWINYLQSTQSIVNTSIDCSNVVPVSQNYIGADGNTVDRVYSMFFQSKTHELIVHEDSGEGRHLIATESIHKNVDAIGSIIHVNTPCKKRGIPAHQARVTLPWSIQAQL